MPSLEHLHSLRQGSPTNYIYVKHTDGKQFVLRPEVYFSQIVRQVLSAKLGQHSCWDWRRSPFEDNCLQTLKSFQMAGLLPLRIYLAHPIEGRAKEELREYVYRVRSTFSSAGLSANLLSMSEIFDEALMKKVHVPEDEKHLFLIELEKYYLKSCDCLIADLSLPQWQYVGTLMEIVYAKNAGIPVVVVSGGSSIASRKWLMGHANAVAEDFARAALVIKKLVSPSAV